MTVWLSFTLRYLLLGFGLMEASLGITTAVLSLLGAASYDWQRLPLGLLCLAAARLLWLAEPARSTP